MLSKQLLAFLVEFSYEGALAECTYFYINKFMYLVMDRVNTHKLGIRKTISIIYTHEGFPMFVSSKTC